MPPGSKRQEITRNPAAGSLESVAAGGPPWINAMPPAPRLRPGTGAIFPLPEGTPRDYDHGRRIVLRTRGSENPGRLPFVVDISPATSTIGRDEDETMQSMAVDPALLSLLPSDAALNGDGRGSPAGSVTVDWTDEELGAAVGAGNVLAETELYLRFRPRIRRKMDQVLHASSDVEDLTSVVLESTLTALRRGTFRGECRLATFVHAVARHKIGEYLRRRRLEPAELTEDLGLADPGPSPDAEWWKEKMAEAVRLAVSELKPKYREVLRLYFFEGLAVREIAVRLEVPPRQVTEWKDYALRLIRTRYGPRLGEYR